MKVSVHILYMIEADEQVVNVYQLVKYGNYSSFQKV